MANINKNLKTVSIVHEPAPDINFLPVNPLKGFIIWGPSTRDDNTREWISEYTGLAEVFSTKEEALSAIDEEGIEGAEYKLIKIVVDVETETVETVKFEVVTIINE